MPHGVEGVHFVNYQSDPMVIGVYSNGRESGLKIHTVAVRVRRPRPVSCTAVTDYQIPTLEKGIEVLLPECICLTTTYKYKLCRVDMDLTLIKLPLMMHCIFSMWLVAKRDIKMAK